MKPNDSLFVELYKSFQIAYDNLSYVHGPAGNIVGLFMHDLMIHFTGILIHRESEGDYGEKFNFPYVNKAYACSPYVLPEIASLSDNRGKGIKGWIGTFGILPFGVGKSLPFGYGQSEYFSKLLPLLGSVHDSTKAYLPCMQQQINFIASLIDKTCTQYEIPNRDAIQQNWMFHIGVHTTNTQVKIKQGSVFLGTRCDLHNRKLAINYLQQDKSVVAFTHGEITNTVLDEPVFGYSDLSYCTTLIDYGSPLKYGKYNNPLIPPSRVIGRSSQLISDFYSEEDIKHSRRKDLKVLYIPTLLSGNALYGPFRGEEDEGYQQWQCVMLDQLAAVFTDVTVKVHPKGIGAGEWPCKTEAKRLEDCIADYDLIILDYYSTAATIAIATNKPIIYFNIGYRNLHEELLIRLKRRCQFVDVDLDGDIATQTKITVEQFLDGSQHFVNDITSDFCFSDNNIGDILLSLASENIKGCFR